MRAIARSPNAETPIAQVNPGSGTGRISRVSTLVPPKPLRGIESPNALLVFRTDAVQGVTRLSCRVVPPGNVEERTVSRPIAVRSVVKSPTSSRCRTVPVVQR